MGDHEVPTGDGGTQEISVFSSIGDGLASEWGRAPVR